MCNLLYQMFMAGHAILAMGIQLLKSQFSGGVGHLQRRSRKLPAPQLYPGTNGSGSWRASRSLLPRCYIHGCLGTWKAGVQLGLSSACLIFRGVGCGSPHQEASLSLMLDSQYPRPIKTAHTSSKEHLVEAANMGKLPHAQVLMSVAFLKGARRRGKGRFKEVPDSHSWGWRSFWMPFCLCWSPL